MHTRCKYDPLIRFIEHYATTHAKWNKATPDILLSIEEQLQQRIVHGDTVGLQRDLDIARNSYSPLQIINNILLEGMKTVGELFGSGQMQLPFVLQSAETMKAAVAYLEQFMEKESGTKKGTLVLATVKGDVHDIGKNLVDIILTNNGYRVINLGIKVSLESILSAADEHHADAIGMSGLLVKSTFIMKENLETMRNREVSLPVILGGAALTRKYVEQDLRNVYGENVSYAQDAFDGLAFMEGIAERMRQENGAHATRTSQSLNPVSTVQPKKVLSSSDDSGVVSSSNVGPAPSIPMAPFYGSKVITDIRIEKVYEFINEVALIRGQWQVKRGTNTKDSYQSFLEKVILPQLASLKLKLKRESILQPAVVYGYFPCQSEGNSLIVFRPQNLPDEELYATWSKASYESDELIEWQRFEFPRQSGDRFLCLADFFASCESGKMDVCAFQIVTIGQRASEYTAALFASDQYQEYLYTHGLSVECTEALAEYWHKSIRTELGIAGKDAAEISKLFSQGYQGARYSFGYPACPNLEDQQQLFSLLKPERIGLTLTEEFQLVPEQSTSAIIVHHPKARYFNVK